MPWKKFCLLFFFANTLEKKPTYPFNRVNSHKPAETKKELQNWYIGVFWSSKSTNSWPSGGVEECAISGRLVLDWEVWKVGSGIDPLAVWARGHRLKWCKAASLLEVTQCFLRNVSSTGLGSLLLRVFKLKLESRKGSVTAVWAPRTRPAPCCWSDWVLTTWEHGCLFTSEFLIGIAWHLRTSHSNSCLPLSRVLLPAVLRSSFGLCEEIGAIPVLKLSVSLTYRELADQGGKPLTTACLAA